MIQGSFNVCVSSSKRLQDCKLIFTHSGQGRKKLNCAGAISLSNRTCRSQHSSDHAIANRTGLVHGKTDHLAISCFVCD